MFSLVVVLSFSIALPVVAGWIKYRKLTGDYRFFIWMMSAALCNETISLISIFTVGNNYVNYNLYLLFGGVTTCYLLGLWRLSFSRKILFVWSLIIVLSWLLEWMWFGTFYRFFCYTDIFSSYLLALLCVSVIAERLVMADYRVKRDPVILLGGGMTISFLSSAVTELFWQWGAVNDPGFSSGVQVLMCCVLAISHLLYLIGIIWAPPKISYILRLFS